MSNSEFKKIFSTVAESSGFSANFKGWFMESPETILVLDLQKSNFSNLYYLNIKIFIQGIFGKSYIKSTDLAKKDIGDIFTRPPKEYSEIFDLSKQDSLLKEKIENLFTLFINPFSRKALTKLGIQELEVSGVITILPAVKEQLNLLN